MKRLIVATHNAHKAREIADLLKELPLEVTHLAALGWTEPIPETGDTYRANARIKCEAILKAYPDCLVLADDSGLEVACLGNQPGIYTARYAGETATQAEKFAHLWRALAAYPQTDWQAKFRCVLALYLPWQQPAGDPPQLQFFEGICPGRILPEVAGEKGFGYDPIFYADEAGCSLAQLSSEAKNQLSHRGKAIQQLKEFLRTGLLQGDSQSPSGATKTN